MVHESIGERWNKITQRYWRWVDMFYFNSGFEDDICKIQVADSWRKSQQTKTTVLKVLLKETRNSFWMKEKYGAEPWRIPIEVG